MKDGRLLHDRGHRKKRLSFVMRWQHRCYRLRIDRICRGNRSVIYWRFLDRRGLLVLGIVSAVGFLLLTLNQCVKHRVQWSDTRYFTQKWSIDKDQYVLGNGKNK